MDSKIDKTKKRAATSSNVELILDLLEDLQAQRKTLQGQIEALEVELTATTNGHITDFMTIVDKLNSVSGRELTNLREHLKAKIAQVVERVDLEVDPRSNRSFRAALATITYTNGKKQYVGLVKFINRKEPNAFQIPVKPNTKAKARKMLEEKIRSVLD